MTYTPPRKSNTFAFIGVILAIIGMAGILLCCCSPLLTAGWCGLFGIPAAILGYLGKQQIKQSGGSEGGESYAQAAMILGGVEILIAVAGFALFILAMVGAITMPAMEEFLNQQQGF